MKRHHLRTAARRQRRGFTLLEVLIVLAILGVIATLVVPRLLGQQRAANEKATALSINAIETALDLYAVDHQGTYPQGGQDVLETLTQPWTDQLTGREREAYMDTLPRDAWQRPFYYEYPNGKVSVDKPAIWSSGVDGKNDEGGGDDINNWNEYL